MKLIAERHRLYMGAVCVAGAAVFLYSLLSLNPDELGLQFLILGLITITVGPRIVFNFFRFNSCVSLSDIFIFLAILLFDGEAAVVIAGLEAYFSSLRVTKKPLTRFFNASAGACSIFLTVLVLRLGFSHAPDLIHQQYSTRLVTATCIMAFVQYVTNSGLIAVAGALRAKLPIWETWRRHYVWTSITYLAGGSAAGIIAKLMGIMGFYAIIAIMPIFIIIYFTYSTYLKNLEASAKQVEQAERHLEEMKKTEERFHRAFDHAPIGMALLAPDGRWLQVNNSLCEIVGYSEQELLASTVQQITHCDDTFDFLTKIDQVVESKALTHQTEVRFTHRRGHEIWTLVGASLLSDIDSTQPHLILQIQDITDRKRAERQLLHEAAHDALTGLPNRVWFMEQLDAALKQDKNKLFAVLFIDLDRFKIINDSLGHLVGDELLIGIAERLRSCLRTDDKVARLGGDEFTILLNDLKDTGEAIEIANRLQRQVSQPFVLSGHETFTTASIGIAFSTDTYKQSEDLLRDADTAMYQAKALGKARHVIFEKGMHARAINRLRLETDLRRAIDRREFSVYYQPIISLETGMLTGFEALVRWRHTEFGLLSPDKFISLAEETGLIVPLGQWVLHEACRQVQLWQERLCPGIPLSISVNLSSKQFAYTGLLEQVIQTLDNTGYDPRLLKLEITESIMMENIEVASQILEQLRARGVQMSIDDFGTGYSSLSYLKRLPINSLKIDRSFVSQISDNNDDREIVHTIILLAHNLRMTVIAEGVETREQLEMLRGLNCDSAQGHLFSKPVDAEAAESLIARLASRQPSAPCVEEGLLSEDLMTVASTYRM